MGKRPDYGTYLHGNPAMAEIWVDAWDRVDNHEKLTIVQEVVLREWCNLATASVHYLELKAQNTFLTDDEYAELAALRETTQEIRRLLA